MRLKIEHYTSPWNVRRVHYCANSGGWASVEALQDSEQQAPWNWYPPKVLPSWKPEPERVINIDGGVLIEKMYAFDNTWLPYCRVTLVEDQN